MKLSIYSQTLTLAAGGLSDPIGIEGNCILLSPVTVDGYTTDIAVKVDDSGFRKIPTGTKISLPGDSTFKSIQFQNTSSGSAHTFHVLALRGDAANYNLQLNGDITVATVTIDDSTPIKVEQQTSVEVVQSSAYLAILERIATACEAIETAADAMVIDLAAIEVSNDTIATNTTP